MNPQERFQAAADLFLRAREIPADRIDAFLAEHCGADHALAAQIRELLAAGDDQDMFGSLSDRLRPLHDGLRDHLSSIGDVSEGTRITSEKQNDPSAKPDAVIGHYR